VVRSFAGIAGLILVPALTQAYSPQSLADFEAGRQYEASRRWAPAAYAYEAALKADPSLTVTYKALGTVYYMAGDRKSALYFYEQYL
jgi:tetratricopeptide (TPR) repeat protein